jgi:diacylglycerol kinase family enzyme
VHAGIAAEATSNAEQLKGVLGTAGYAMGALRAGVVAHGWHLRVRVDDEVVTEGDRPVLMVSIAVGRSVGGGTLIAPGASPTNGQAQVMVCTATDPSARASFAWDLQRGRHTAREDVTVLRGRSVRVEAVGEHPFGVNTDGDLDGEHWSRLWTVQDNAWVCRVPPE